MDIKEKLNYIQYSKYRYDKKKWNAEETKDFFDLDFSKLLFDNTYNVINSQDKLLSYFDFHEIFSSFANDLTSTQEFLLKFMTIKRVKGVDLLLQNMPYDLKEQFFYQLYIDFKSKNDKPFYLAQVIFCINEQEKLRFINNILDDIRDDELLYVIKDLYVNKCDALLTKLLNNERIANIAVQKISAPFFYEMLEELHLSSDLKTKRETELKNIIINQQDYDIDDIKNAYCDLYFHDIFKNVCLDIKTIIDFADDDETFKNDYLGELYDLLSKVYTFLNSDMKNLEENIELLNNCPLNHEIIAKCYLMCQERFKKLVSQSIKQNIIANVTPKILLSSLGEEVKFYTIGDIDPQKHLTMLVSTIPCSNDARSFKQTYYSEENGEIKNGRRSGSLINETKLTSLFGGNGRITFGYEDLRGRIITSATLSDGCTDGNEERFRRHRKVRKSSYLSVNKFVESTQSHTELTINMGQTGEIMKPSFILITTDTPTQFEIDVAAEFGIPIRCVINKYEQKTDVHHSYSFEDYDYCKFDKKTITANKQDIKKF